MTGEPGCFVVGTQCVLAVLGLERVDVDGSV